MDPLNSCHKTIKFTADISPTQATFLDTTIGVTPDRSLQSTLYTKPTDSHNYLLYSSCHPRSCRDSIPYSQFLRVRRICSLESDFQTNALTLASHFKRRGYPTKLIEESFLKASKIKRQELLHPTRKATRDETEKPFLTLTYNPTNYPSKLFSERPGPFGQVEGHKAFPWHWSPNRLQTQQITQIF